MSALPEALRLLIAALLGILAFSGGLWALNRLAPPPQAQGSLSLDQTIADIKSELAVLENTPGPQLGLTLSEVKIELQLARTDEQTGSAALAVPVFTPAELKAGGTQSVAQGSRLTVLLVPPTGRSTLGTADRPQIRFAELLLAARASLAAAMETEPRLDAKSIEVQVSFVLVREATAGAEVSVKVLTLGSTASRAQTSGNTVTLTYQNPAYAKPAKAAPTPP